MAKANSTPRLVHKVSDSTAPEVPQKTIAADLEDALNPYYQAKAMLQGALALIEDPGAYNDPHGEVWAAREIIEVAMGKVDEISMRVDDLKIFERIAVLEGGAA